MVAKFYICSKSFTVTDNCVPWTNAVWIVDLSSLAEREVNHCHTILDDSDNAILNSLSRSSLLPTSGPYQFGRLSGRAVIRLSFSSKVTVEVNEGLFWSKIGRDGSSEETIRS
jgi:hypothetical protein